MTKIASLYAERLMSDLILVVGKQELPAHRLILCASSEVFQVSAWSTIENMFPLQVMLMNKNWAEHEEKRIILKETPACQNVFEVITSSTLYRITFPILGFPQIPLHGKDPSRLCQCHPYPSARRQV